VFVLVQVRTCVTAQSCCRHPAAVLSQQEFHAVQAGNIHKSLLTLSCVIRGLADNQVS
jgi:hypothetical protein